MEANRRVAFVTPRMTSTFSRVIWYSLQASARTKGIRLTAVVGGTLDHPTRATPSRRVYDLLLPTNFDGIVLFTGAVGYYSQPEVMSNFLDQIGSLPLVSLGINLDGHSSVSIDQGEAVEQAVRHLFSVHGYRRFAFVAGPPEHPEAQIRRLAFFRAIRALEIRDQDVREFPGDFTKVAGADAVNALVHAWPGVTALVCCNDEEALGALEAAKSQGLTVPTQLAVVGFDDVERAPLVEPSLTTVSQPFIRQANRALELLVEQMDHRSPPKREVEIARLICRASCGCGNAAPVPPPRDKADLIAALLDPEFNATPTFLAFANEWISDYLTAFEYGLETGNSSVLRGQWALYHRRRSLEQERGISFRLLFAGLTSLYGRRSGFAELSNENLMLAGAAEARKSVEDDQLMRTFFFQLHAVELAIGQINDKVALSQFPLEHLQRLGLLGLAVVSFGATTELLYGKTIWTANEVLPGALQPRYPELLPPLLSRLDLPAHRIVVALVSETLFLGYAVFWTNQNETYVCDFLANQFSGVLQRIELLERIREQSRSLELSLEESKKMQERLVETEKVAALGRVVAGVAHEVNTPLGTGITGASFVLDRLTEVQSQFEAGTLPRSALSQFLTQGRTALEGVVRNLMKTGELIQAFKGLGLDHVQGDWAPVDLRSLFSDLQSLYRSEMAKRELQLLCDLPEEGTFFFSQSAALVQVTSELLENAMSHAFTTVKPGTGQVLLQVFVKEGTLTIAVTDNGRGLDQEERKHLFDPLFTTQRPQGHSGLGLHLAFQIVTRTLSGSLTVASEPGAGSCFLCLIPSKPA